jgi:hypothetical protein
MHRIANNCVGISLYGINDILLTDNIPIETFIIRQIYEIYAFSLIGNISSDKIYNLVHLDTRGCLFDMNGDKTDILYNTESPIICNSCHQIFNTRQVSSKAIGILTKELKTIRKPKILALEKYIKKHPFISVLLSSIIGAIIARLINDIFDIVLKLILNK